MIGLYVNPPDHAVVFAVDEKTAIQALDRLDPVLPLVARPRRAPRLRVPHRHGTLSLFAALNTQSGEVLGQSGCRGTPVPPLSNGRSNHRGKSRRMLLRHARSHSPRALNVSHITSRVIFARDG